MSIFRNDTLGSWTRGGQAIVHNVRMTTQVFYQTILAGFIIWIMDTLWYAFEKSTEYERFVLVKLAEATIKVDAAAGTNDPVQFRTPEGQAYWTSADWLVASTLAKKTLHAFEGYLLHGALLSGLFTLVMLAWAWFYFTRTGRGLGSNEYLRGARFGTIRQVKRALWRQTKGPLVIGNVPVPEAYEPEHILLCGAPGTGKTNLIVGMLDGIRKSGRRAIVYDTAGTFVEKFYRQGTDMLLNPLDQRAARWSPWVDVPRDYHYDQIAESTIPDKHGDPFWAKAARGTLVAVMRKLARQKHTYVSVLLDRLLRSKLKDLAAFVTGTDAAAFISTEGERTSAGIQAELASVMRSFGYLDDTEDGFSVRDWVEKGADGSWLFITVKADQLPSLRPLITVWLDIAISAIMSLVPDRDRRLYCVIDELPTLHKLPSLSDFLARARKYGGCGILGFQSYPQLKATYGRDDAAAITGYCSTWVALRANDTDTADHVSINLGQVEQVEANEGMSYGVNDMRDGVNLSRMQVTRHQSRGNGADIWRSAADRNCPPDCCQAETSSSTASVIVLIRSGEASMPYSSRRCPVISRVLMPRAYIEMILSPQLLYARRRAMNPLAFEELLLESFEQRGHKVVCNRRYTGDGGIDEQVVINGAIWLIQAKRYAGAIRPEHIVAFDTLCQTRRCRGLFIHTGRTGPQSRVSASHNSAVEIISARSLFALLTSGPVPVSGVCSDPADPITSLRTTSGRAG